MYLESNGDAKQGDQIVSRIQLNILLKNVVEISI